jgi:hypothetical protein
MTESDVPVNTFDPIAVFGYGPPPGFVPSSIPRKRLSDDPDFVRALNAQIEALSEPATAPKADGPVLMGKPWFRASSLVGVPPPRQWVTRDMIPARAVTLLSGAGGLGKSSLTLDLAIAAVTGRAWCQKWTVRRGPVLLVSIEDDREEIWRRLYDMTDGDTSILDDVHIITTDGQDPILNKPNSVTWRDLVAMTHEFNPSLIVIDNLALAFEGDEINRQQVSQFMRQLHTLAAASGAGLVLLQHPSLTGLASGSGQSGSTAWRNAARALIIVESDPKDSDGRTLRVGKMNFGPSDSNEHSLIWVGGRYIVRDPNSGPSVQERDADLAFIRCLELSMMRGERVGLKKGTNYAPARFEKMPLANGVGKAALARAMDRLLDAGTVLNVSSRENGRDVSGLQIAPHDHHTTTTRPPTHTPPITPVLVVGS